MDSKGDVVDLYDFRGKPVIVEFMQTTCPHCAAFAGVLDKVQKQFGDKVGIISIANPPDNPTTVGNLSRAITSSTRSCSTPGRPRIRMSGR